MKRLLFLVFSVICFLQINAEDNTWLRLKQYLLKSTKVNDFDGSVFVVKGKLKEYPNGALLLNGKDIVLNKKDSIPYSVYSEFVEANAKKSFLIQDDGKNFIGFSTTDIIPAKSGTYYYPICYRNRMPHIYEFVLLSTEKEYNSTFISLMCYDESKGRLKSDVLLFDCRREIDFSEFDNLGKCRALLAEDYECISQTLSISNGMITQTYGRQCGPEELPCDGLTRGFRKVLFNEEREFYEVVWDTANEYTNSASGDSILVHSAMAYNCVINDKDGYTNVREHASTESPVLYKINKDEVFVVSNKERNGWYRVIKYGDKCSGWIHKSRVSILSKALDFFDEGKTKDYFEEYYWMKM